MAIDDNYTTEDGTDETPRETPADLRRAADEGKKAKQEAAALRRENAFLKAGVTIDDPKLAYFYKGYDGDLEPEKIKAAAVEAGFLSPDPAVVQEQMQQQQTIDAQQRVASASTGAFPEDATLEAGFARMDQAYAEGGLPALANVMRQYGVGIATHEI